MNILGIVPARAGSRGVPNKNVKEIAGAPLISHTIRAAKLSGVFSRIVVTSDSEDILEIGEQEGIPRLFIREPHLASDSANAIEVISDAISRTIQITDERFDAVCMLQPTSPLRRSIDCRNIVEIFKKSHYGSIISATPVSEHPYKMVRRSSTGEIISFLDWPIENPPRQSLPELFVYNGAFYLFDLERFFALKSFKIPAVGLYLMDKRLSVNIDDEIDFALAEHLLSSKKCPT